MRGFCLPTSKHNIAKPLLHKDHSNLNVIKIVSVGVGSSQKEEGFQIKCWNGVQWKFCFWFYTSIAGFYYFDVYILSIDFCLCGELAKLPCYRRKDLSVGRLFFPNNNVLGNYQSACSKRPISLKLLTFCDANGNSLMCCNQTVVRQPCQ